MVSAYISCISAVSHVIVERFGQVVYTKYCGDKRIQDRMIDAVTMLLLHDSLTVKSWVNSLYNLAMNNIAF